MRTGESSLNNIAKAVKTDWKKYEADLKYQQVYNKIAGKGVPPTLEEDYILNTRNNTIPFPPKKPSHMVIVDDCQGTDMYSLARRDLMNHVTIKHRHIPITICYLMQSWSGLPRVIRLNATHFTPLLSTHPCLPSWNTISSDSVCENILFALL